jgi:hypothetical protein
MKKKAKQKCLSRTGIERNINWIKGSYEKFVANTNSMRKASVLFLVCD